MGWRDVAMRTFFPQNLYAAGLSKRQYTQYDIGPLERERKEAKEETAPKRQGAVANGGDAESGNDDDDDCNRARQTERLREE